MGFSFDFQRDDVFESTFLLQKTSVFVEKSPRWRSGARKIRVVRLLMGTVQSTDITKLNHTDFSR